MRERYFASCLLVGAVVLMGAAAGCGGNGKSPVSVARVDGGDAAGAGDGPGGGSTGRRDGAGQRGVRPAGLQRRRLRSVLPLVLLGGHRHRLRRLRQRPAGGGRDLRSRQQLPAELRAAEVPDAAPEERGHLRRRLCLGGHADGLCGRRRVLPAGLHRGQRPRLHQPVWQRHAGTGRAVRSADHLPADLPDAGLHAAGPGRRRHLPGPLRGGRAGDAVPGRRRLLPQRLQRRQRQRLRRGVRQRRRSRAARPATRWPPAPAPARPGLPAAAAGQRRHLHRGLHRRRPADHLPVGRRLLPGRLQQHQRQRLPRPVRQQRHRGGRDLRPDRQLHGSRARLRQRRRHHPHPHGRSRPLQVHLRGGRAHLRPGRRRLPARLRPDPGPRLPRLRQRRDGGERDLRSGDRLPGTPAARA